MYTSNIRISGAQGQIQQKKTGQHMSVLVLSTKTHIPPKKNDTNIKDKQVKNKT